MTEDSVNSRGSFADLPHETQSTVLDWIHNNIYPRKETTDYGCRGYSEQLACALEWDTGIYLTCKEFEEAMVLKGYPVLSREQYNGRTHSYCIYVSSPALKKDRHATPDMWFRALGCSLLGMDSYTPRDYWRICMPHYYTLRETIQMFNTLEGRGLIRIAPYNDGSKPHKNWIYNLTTQGISCLGSMSPYTHLPFGDFHRIKYVQQLNLDELSCDIGKAMGRLQIKWWDATSILKIFNHMFPPGPDCGWTQIQAPILFALICDMPQYSDEISNAHLHYFDNWRYWFRCTSYPQ